MQKDLISTISSMMPHFSKRQRQIARYIADHYDKAAFMTASRLGQSVGVSESTVVRFAAELGFEGYPQLQRSLQEMIRNRLTSVQRMQLTGEQIGDGDLLQRILSMDIEKIRRTMEETSRVQFAAAVEALITSKRIYIMGIRSSFALASFLAFYFNHVFDDVRMMTAASSSDVFEQMVKIRKDDVFIGISFPRYSRRTLKAMKYAKDKGAQTIAITDSGLSPIAELANFRLYAQSDMTSFVDSLVAPMALINALIVAVGLEKRETLSQNYAEFERIWEDYEVYTKADDRE